jgi:hypothetical protein
MLVALLALGCVRASTAEASEGLAAFFLSDVQVLYDSPTAPPLTLVGEMRPASRFDYALFASELVAYVAKEVLDDSPDEFAGNSLIPSTLSPSMPATDHDFGSHCLKVVKDIGQGIADADMPVIGRVGASAPAVTNYAGHAIGAAFALREVWKLIRNDIENHSEGFSLHPKVGSNKVALSLTVRW